MMCLGSAGISPFSTRFTISVSAALAGVAMPTVFALSTMKPLRNSISVAPALHHVLAHRGPVRAAAGLARLGQPVLVVFALRAAGSPSPARAITSGVDVVDLLQRIAQRLADPDRLRPEPRGEVAQRVVRSGCPC